MGRTILGAALLAAALAGPGAVGGTRPPEGDFKATFWAVDDKAKAAEVPAAPDGAWSFVETLAYTNDAGAGFLHEATGRCIGSGGATEGGGNHNSGWCAYADADGDQIFST